MTQVNDIQQPLHDVEGETCDTWTWGNEETTVRYQLLQDFVLNKYISPLLIMQQWHLGLSQPDGSRISPLKTILLKDFPKKQIQIFHRMKKFYKSIDQLLEILEKPELDVLNELMRTNRNRLVESKILLPPRTGSGKKRTRNETGWGYIAHQYEKRLCIEKKARREGITLEEV